MSIGWCLTINIFVGEDKSSSLLLIPESRCYEGGSVS